MKEKYRGIFPAFYACYEEDGRVSAGRTRALVRHLIGKGIRGVYACGSSGECIYLDVDERKAMLEAIMDEAAGRLTVIAHVACNNTRDSVELARHAQSLGVDAIAAIPPIYFRLPDHAIAEYWNAISAGAPDTDFFIYNIPQLAGVALSAGLLRRMLENPRVAGVKNSSVSTQDIQVWKSIGGEDFVVFNGPDEQYVAGRSIGADGGIGGTYGAMPELYLKMHERFEAGDLAGARRIQYACNDIIEALCSSRANMYAVIKETLRRREGLDLGGVRAPLAGVSRVDEPVIERCCRMIDGAMSAFAG